MRRTRTSIPLLLGLTICGVACKSETPPNTKRPSAQRSHLQLQPPTAFISNLKESERIHSELSRLMKAELLAKLQRKDFTGIQAKLAPEFQAQFPSPEADSWLQENGLHYWVNTATQSAPILSAKPFLSALEAAFKELILVERTAWKVFENKIAQDQKSAFQRAHFQIAGSGPDRGRLEVRAIVAATFSRNPKNEWQIQSLDFEDTRWTKSKWPVFRDIGPQTGFGFNPSQNTEKLIQAVIDERRLFTVGGITVLDFNHDNYWDLIASYANRETRLFINDGQGGFVHRDLPLLSKPTEVSKAYLWLDLDNDGQEELVGTHAFNREKNHAEFGLYQFSRRGKMTQKKAALQFKRPAWMRRMSFESVVACDVNGDQKLDLLFTGYSHLDSEEHENLLDAKDGLRNLLFINQGGLKFSEESLTRGLTRTQYSFVASCYDFDKDGDADIMIGNDYGKNNFYRNRGDGYFIQDKSHPFHLGSSFSMGVSIADYDNRGKYAVSISNMYSHAGLRIIPLARELESKQADFMRLVRGNSLYEETDKGWQDTAAEKFVDNAGWAWGNVFFDFDNDQDKDLLVLNGYTSHSDPNLPDF